MAGLYFYTDAETATPIGMAGGANGCWAEALTQALFSLPAFMKVVRSDNFGRINSETANLIKTIFAAAKPQESSAAALANICSKISKTFDGHSQQCAHEAFTLLIDECKSKDLEAVFLMRHKVLNKCAAGITWSSGEDTAFSYERRVKLIGPDFNTQLKMDAERVHIRHSHDNERTPCVETHAQQVKLLCRLGSVIVIHHDKTTAVGQSRIGILDDLPSSLEFMYDDEKSPKRIVRYRPVAIINGCAQTYDLKTSSGHYTAQCLRGGAWYNFNGSRVENLSGAPPFTTNTTMVFYHVFSS